MTQKPTDDLRTIKLNGTVIDIERRWLVGTGEFKTGEPLGDDWVQLPTTYQNSQLLATTLSYYYPRYERVRSEWRVIESRENL